MHRPTQRGPSLTPMVTSSSSAIAGCANPRLVATSVAVENARDASSFMTEVPPCWQWRQLSHARARPRNCGCCNGTHGTFDQHEVAELVIAKPADLQHFRHV